jgi:excisionase family DNA binding protein
MERATEERATYTINELKQVLGVGRDHIYAGLRAGRIPHLRMGKRFIIPRAAVDLWLKNAGQQVAPVKWPEVGGYRA